MSTNHKDWERKVEFSETGTDETVREETTVSDVAAVSNFNNPIIAKHGNLVVAPPPEGIKKPRRSSINSNSPTKVSSNTHSKTQPGLSDKVFGMFGFSLSSTKKISAAEMEAKRKERRQFALQIAGLQPSSQSTIPNTTQTPTPVSPSMPAVALIPSATSKPTAPAPEKKKVEAVAMPSSSRVTSPAVSPSPRKSLFGSGSALATRRAIIKSASSTPALPQPSAPSESAVASEVSGQGSAPAIPPPPSARRASEVMPPTIPPPPASRRASEVMPPSNPPPPPLRRQTETAPQVLPDDLRAALGVLRPLFIQLHSDPEDCSFLTLCDKVHMGGGELAEAETLQAAFTLVIQYSNSDLPGERPHVLSSVQSATRNSLTPFSAEHMKAIQAATDRKAKEHEEKKREQERQLLDLQLEEHKKKAIEQAQLEVNAKIHAIRTDAREAWEEAEAVIATAARAKIEAEEEIENIRASFSAEAEAEIESIRLAAEWAGIEAAKAAKLKHTLALEAAAVAAETFSETADAEPDTAPIAAPQHGQIQYFVHDRIEGQFEGAFGCNIWYPGVISEVYEDGTYLITYDDGDTEDKVQPMYIRFFNTALIQEQDTSQLSQLSQDETIEVVAESSMQYEELQGPTLREEAVGKRIHIHFEDETGWLRGIIVGYLEDIGQHDIVFEDQSRCELDLRQEVIRIQC